jgi:hypothetical protein
VSRQRTKNGYLNHEKHEKHEKKQIGKKAPETSFCFGCRALSEHDGLMLPLRKAQKTTSFANAYGSGQGYPPLKWSLLPGRVFLLDPRFSK